eukprot:jgi/Mesvir1/23061/Mv25059-RA.1
MPVDETHTLPQDHGIVAETPPAGMRASQEAPAAPEAYLRAIPGLQPPVTGDLPTQSGARRRVGFHVDTPVGDAARNSDKGPASRATRAHGAGMPARGAMNEVDVSAGASTEASGHRSTSRHGDGWSKEDGNQEDGNTDDAQGFQGSADPGKEMADPMSKYVDYSLGILSRRNPLRAACIRLSSSPHIQSLVLFIILLNCVFLALYDPTRGQDEGRNRLFDDTELFFACFFIVEMCVKVVAMGAVADRRCFLRDPWNALDFVVVVGSMVALMPNLQSSVASIRSVRVLRVLRTASLLPGVRRLVETILRSLPILFNVVLLFGFLYLLFGILGVQLFGGHLMARCFVSELLTSDNMTEAEKFEDEGEGVFHPNIMHVGYTLAGDDVCTNESRPWPGNICDPSRGAVCLRFRNPNYGLTSFDDFLQASVTIFQIISLEGWTGVMYACMDGTSGWAFVYFVVLVFSGSFFLLNLALAVITDVHAESSEEAHLYEEAHKSQKQRKPGGRGALPGFLERHSRVYSCVQRITGAAGRMWPLAALAREVKTSLWDPPACHRKYRLAFIHHSFGEAEATPLASSGAHAAFLAKARASSRVGASRQSDGAGASHASSSMGASYMSHLSEASQGSMHMGASHRSDRMEAGPGVTESSTEARIGRDGESRQGVARGSIRTRSLGPDLNPGHTSGHTGAAVHASWDKVSRRSESDRATPKDSLPNPNLQVSSLPREGPRSISLPNTSLRSNGLHNNRLPGNRLPGSSSEHVHDYATMTAGAECAPSGDSTGHGPANKHPEHDCLETSNALPVGMPPRGLPGSDPTDADGMGAADIPRFVSNPVAQIVVSNQNGMKNSINDGEWPHGGRLVPPVPIDMLSPRTATAPQSRPMDYAAVSPRDSLLRDRLVHASPSRLALAGQAGCSSGSRGFGSRPLPPASVVAENGSLHTGTIHRVPALTASTEFHVGGGMEAWADEGGNDADASMSIGEEMRACCIFTTEGGRRRHGLRCLVAQFIYSRAIVLGFYLAILTNTVVMASSYHGMPRAYKDALDKVGARQGGKPYTLNLRPLTGKVWTRWL